MLGLRYRPSAQADLEAHAGMLALLISDLADIPPAYLDRAIQRWVMRSPYMPKACELATLAQEAMREDEAKREFTGPRPWEQQDTFREEDRCTPEEAAAIMAEFGLPSATRQKVARCLGKPRNPTREDYLEMGVDPSTIDQIPQCLQPHP